MTAYFDHREKSVLPYSPEARDPRQISIARMQTVVAQLKGFPVTIIADTSFLDTP